MSSCQSVLLLGETLSQEESAVLQSNHQPAGCLQSGLDWEISPGGLLSVSQHRAGRALDCLTGPRHRLHDGGDDGQVSSIQRPAGGHGGQLLGQAVVGLS